MGPDGPDTLKPKATEKRVGDEKVVGKRGLSLTSNLDLLRQHSGYGARGAGDRGRALASRGKKWTGVANNMQLLREGSWERRTRGDRLYKKGVWPTLAEDSSKRLEKSSGRSKSKFGSRIKA